MVASRKSWIEDEGKRGLQEVVSWKNMGKSKYDKLPSRLLEKGMHKFEDDGSSLWAHVKHVVTDQFLVQVVKFLETKSPFSCIVSDGFTTVRAKFPKAAVDELKRTGHLDNFSEMSNEAILNIHKFRMKASPSGPDDQRVTIFIDSVQFCQDQKVWSSGNRTRHFYEAPGVRELLDNLKSTMRAREDSEPVQYFEPSQPSGRTRVYEHGRRTQEFATQVRPDLANDGFEMQHGANLAAPVAPRRKDGGKVFGTKPLYRDKSPDAYQLLCQEGTPNAFQQLQYLHSESNATKKVIGSKASISIPQPSGEIIFLDDTDSSELDEKGRVISDIPQSDGESPQLAHSVFNLDIHREAYESYEGFQDIPQYDGMHGENVAEGRIHERAIFHAQSEAGESSCRSVAREEFEAARAQHQYKLAREAKARGGKPPIPYTPGTGPLNPLELQIWNFTKGFTDYSELDAKYSKSQTPQSSSRPAMDSAGPPQNTLITSTSNMSTSNTSTSKGANSTSKEMKAAPEAIVFTPNNTKVTSMWRALQANPPTRPHCGLPSNQEDLLNKPQSANHGTRPPIGIQSAKPTVPIDILTSHTRADIVMSGTATNVQQTSQTADYSQHDPSTPVTATSSPMSEVEPSEDEDPGMPIDWPETPEHLFSDALPPDSSPLSPMHPKNPLVEHNESAFSSPNLPGQRISSSEKHPSAAPDQAAHSLKTNKAYSQALAGMHAPMGTEEPTRTPAGSTCEMDLNKVPDTTKTNQLFSSAVRPKPMIEPTLYPSIRNHSALSQLSTLSSSNFVSNPAKQSRDLSLSASKQYPSEQLVSSTSSSSKASNLSIDNVGNLDEAESDLPSEVHATRAEKQIIDDFSASALQDVQSYQHQASSELDTPDTHTTSHDITQSSYKRRAPPTISPDRERKLKSSRFDLTQESPVSQNPAETTAMARAEFLNGKKETGMTAILSKPILQVPSKQTQPDQEQSEYDASDVIGTVNDKGQPSAGQHPDICNVPSGSQIVPSNPQALTENPPSSHSRAIASVTTNSLTTISTVEGLYHDFTGAYPNYPGSIEQFRNLCAMIMASTPGRVKLYIVMHQTRYDDFLLTYNPDFIQYNLEAVSAGLNADTYDIWYLNKGEGKSHPHTKMIVTNEKLETLHAAGELGFEDDGYVAWSLRDETEFEDNRGRAASSPNALAPAQMPTPDGQRHNIGGPSNKWGKRIDRVRDNAGPQAQLLIQNDRNLMDKPLHSELPNVNKEVAPRNPWKMAKKVQEGSEWWRDSNSAYNEFAAAYQNLKSVKKAKESEGAGTMGVLKWDW